MSMPLDNCARYDAREIVSLFAYVDACVRACMSVLYTYRYILLAIYCRGLMFKKVYVCMSAK